MTNTTDIEYIKNLRNNFLHRINFALDNNFDYFIGDFEFINVIMKNSELHIFDFVNYYFEDKTQWNDNLKSEEIFTNLEYTTLYNKFKKDYEIYNWIQDSKYKFSTENNIMKLMNQADSYMNSDILTKSYYNFITMVMCIDYIKKIEKKSFSEI